MPHFQTFTRSMSNRKGTPRLTVLRSGMFSLNKPAFLALGEPDAVELLFDIDEGVIGLRPVTPSFDTAYIVRRPSRGDSGPYLITALAFTKFYDIDTDESFRWDATLDDGILCVRLGDDHTAVTSNRAGTSATRPAPEPVAGVVPLPRPDSPAAARSPRPDHSNRTRFG